MSDIERIIHAYRNRTGYDVRIEFDRIPIISIIDRMTGEVIAETGTTSLSRLEKDLDSYSSGSVLWVHRASRAGDTHMSQMPPVPPKVTCPTHGLVDGVHTSSNTWYCPKCIIEENASLFAEVEKLTAENAAHLEYRAKELQHLQQLVGSPTWKKVVEGSRNPNFMTLQEKIAEQSGRGSDERNG